MADWNASGVLLSSRAIHGEVSRGVTYEFEDLVAELLGLQILAPVVPLGPSLRRKAWWAGRQPRLLRRNPRQQAGSFVFAMGQCVYDLADQMANLDVIERASVRVAYIEEMWRTELPLRRDLRAFLDRFDHVFLGLEGTCAPLSQLIEPPVTYLPPALNLDRYTKGGPLKRIIDVYAMGRRNPFHHQVLLDWARQTEAFYHFDTFVQPRVSSLGEHRSHLVELIRRSRYFMVNEAKVDQPDQRGRQSEVAYRHFEGAAAGAVLVGPAPRTCVFSRLFSWSDAIIEVAEDGSDLVAAIEEFDADPARLARARKCNVDGMLRAHDVAHRVREVLRRVDIREPRSVDERIRHLADRADQLLLN